MRRYKRRGAGGNIAATRFISAVLLILVLSGCAGVKSNKDQAASMTPPKQLAGPKLPMPEAGAQPATLASTGSIWSPASNSLCADVRAAKIGDVVTITVSETSAASKASATTAQKAKTSTGSLTFGGIGFGAAGVASPKGAMSLGPYNTSFANTFTGTGATSQTDSMTAYMTATVIDVLPNGNLLIRGSRWTKVNDELQQIVLEGVIRPADISRLNTVLSQNVAEAKIFLLGKGPVAQSQKPGWLNQVIDFISPF
jgi:flagellar L-ring protein precursor FlgH